MAIVFNVSRNGEDANTTDLNKLVASSLGTQLKIIRQKSGSVTIPSANFERELKLHTGLTYAPAFKSYWEHPDDPGRYWLDGTNLGTMGLSAYDSQTFVDNNLIHLIARRGDSPQTGDRTSNYVYCLFDQPAGMAASGNGEPIDFVKQKQGLIVSQESFNANTAKLYQQQFNSNVDFLKYHFTKSDKLVFDNTSDGSATATITHNLGYIPLFDVWARNPLATPSVFRPLPIGAAIQGFASGAGASKTNITINLVFIGGGGAGNEFIYRVVIFKNRMVI